MSPVSVGVCSYSYSYEWEFNGVHTGGAACANGAKLGAKVYILTAEQGLKGERGGGAERRTYSMNDR